jgi:hypothetical protein
MGILEVRTSVARVRPQMRPLGSTRSVPAFSGPAACWLTSLAISMNPIPSRARIQFEELKWPCRRVR